jgi:hypothetical protein
LRKWIQFSINIFPIFLAPFALGYLFFPTQTLSLMGFQTDATGILFLQFIGAFAASFAVLLWATRKSDKAVRSPVIFATLIMMAIQFIVVLSYYLDHGFGIFGGFGVFMYGLAVAMLGYEYWALQKD